MELNSFEKANINTHWMYNRNIRIALLQEKAIWYQFTKEPKVVNKLVWTKLSNRFKQHLIKLWEIQRMQDKLRKFISSA